MSMTIIGPNSKHELLITTGDSAVMFIWQPYCKKNILK